MQTLLNQIKKSSRKLSTACLLLITAATVTPGMAQNQPAVLFEGLLDTYFDDQSGLIAFEYYDLAFAPDEPLDAQACVRHADGAEVACLPLRPQYRNRMGVIARASAANPADVSLTEPGKYLIEFSVNGQPATRMPVTLEKIQSGDAFNPEVKLRFHGPWSQYAHITMNKWQDENWPLLSFWAGQRDITDDAFRTPFMVELKRNGQLVAHSKQTQGNIPNEHYQRLEVSLYHPHDRKQSPNAKPFMQADWTRDGEYEITVLRQSDNAVIRTFRYTAGNGEIQALPQTRPGHQPHAEYLAPRVIKKGSTGYEFVEAIWLKN